MLMYIHVPFCRRKCRYCAFASEPLTSGGEERMREYVETLLAELRFWHARLKNEGSACGVETIFWGGGTPSLLEPDWVRRVLDEARALFDVAPDAEISMEANPDSLRTRERASEFLAAGVNRISLGVQTLDDRQLRELGRLHRASEAVQAARAAREAGCANLSLDLMWGLPGQTPEQWRDVLRAAVGLEPDHVSAYGLTLEPGTPMAEAGVSLPDEEILAVMFADCADVLEKAGLRQYEISNYAREGFRCRHNLGYWEGKEYLGLGPAATSTLKDARWTNPADVAVWTRQVGQGSVSPDRETLTAVVRTLEIMMLRLRTTDGLPLALYKKCSGRDFLADHGGFVRELTKHGLAELAERGEPRLFLTRQGMLLSNSVLETLFEETRRLLD